MVATAYLYENEPDRKLHSSAIQRLARDFNIAEEEIRVLYETTLSNLRETARIKDFLVILASRNVKDMLKGSMSSQT